MKADCMDPEYVFLQRPSDVWAIEYTSVRGNRVVYVIGTEYAAREAMEQYAVAGPILLRSSADFHPVMS